MRSALALAAAALLLPAACGPTSRSFSAARQTWEDRSNSGISDWSNISSNKMVDEYGPPDRVETLGLVWYHRGPWAKIVVWDEMGFLWTDKASRNLEQTIAYPVPDDKRSALAAFNRALWSPDLGVRVSENGAELSARSESEERNFLMLNLADEIVQGLLSPRDARESFSRTLQLADAGKTSPSMQRLLFR